MSKRVIRLKEIIDEIKRDREILLEKREKTSYYNNVKK